MNASPLPGRLAGFLGTAALLTAIATTTGISETARPEASRNLVLWDTVSPLGDRLNPDDRSAWKGVPNDLLLLETNSLKASSDPGYYGRDYAFEGDAVVETPRLTAVFWSAKGCVAIYSREDPSAKGADSKPAAWTEGKILDVCPVLAGPGPASISHIEVVRNAADKIVLKISFSSAGSPRSTGVFSFDKTGIVEVKPVENMKQVRLSGAIQYGVVPGFIGDDLVFGGPEHCGTDTLAVPSESLFLGLLPGESKELVVTWPKGKQRVNLHFGEGPETNIIRAVEFEAEGQSFFLAVLSAPGIWHKETLTADYLEKDVAIQWKRPFPARWKTLLYEEELKTTFTFRSFKGQIWRGVAGSYEYPVWFSGDQASYRLGKKVQPKGESLIYCLEGQDTPLTVLTPADVLEQTLGRAAAADVLDFAGRKLRTHHRRGGAGVRRACTCGCTEAILAVFEAGQELSQKDYIQGALDDMIYFVRCHVERINEYRRFADELLKGLQEKRRSSPDLKPFLDSIEEIARQIPQECEVQKENMKTLAYADELLKRTIALASNNDTNNLKTYKELLKAWRDMGGAQDYVVAKCHTITRSLCQAAGYGCAAWPGAVPLAEQIRAKCRQTLRNPDGYEIWADY